MRFLFILLFIAFYSIKGEKSSEIMINLGGKNLEALKDIFFKHYVSNFKQVDLPNLSGSMLLGKYKGTNIHYCFDPSTKDVFSSHFLLNEDEGKITIKITNVTFNITGTYSYKLGFISELLNILGFSSKGIIEINLSFPNNRRLEITAGLSVEYEDFSLQIDPSSTTSRIFTAFKYLYYNKILSIVSSDLQERATNIQDKLNVFLQDKYMSYKLHFLDEIIFTISKISTDYFKPNLEFTLPFIYSLNPVNSSNILSKGNFIINFDPHELQKNMSLFIDLNLIKVIKEYLFQEEMSNFYIECPIFPISFFLNCSISNEFNYLIKNNQLYVDGSNYCEVESKNQSLISTFSFHSKYEVSFNNSITNKAIVFFTNGSQIILKDLIFTNHKGSDITFFEDNLEFVYSNIADYFNYILNQSNHFLKFTIPSFLNITEIQITNNTQHLEIEPVISFNLNETMKLFTQIFL